MENHGEFTNKKVEVEIKMVLEIKNIVIIRGWLIMMRKEDKITRRKRNMITQKNV